VIVYLDSSVLARAYLADEVGHEEALTMLEDPEVGLITGTWTRIEVSGALVRAARTGRGDEGGLLTLLDADLAVDGPVTVVAAAQEDVEVQALTGTFTVKRGLADMLRGGVIMDVVDAEQAKVAEDAGAVAVMALERVPSDIRRDGGVARMSDPELIEGIQAAVTIPVMAKARIGHFAEAQVLAEPGRRLHRRERGAHPGRRGPPHRQVGLRGPLRVRGHQPGGGAAADLRGRGHDPLQGRGGHRQHRRGRPPPALDPRGHPPGDRGRLGRALRLGQGAGAPIGLVQEIASTGRLPVPLFCAGGIATPADASLVMQLGAEAVFVGSGIFKSSDPAAHGPAVVEATAHYTDADLVAKVSTGLGRCHA
jgi:pyridoxal 5'-phosphate synthase pdxS subunit